MDNGNLSKLREFVMEFSKLLSRASGEADIISEGSRLLATLVRKDDWLPDEFSQPSAERYCQYLLHCDSAERFSVVSFVWGPGQETPIHDHRTWGLIGMLRGAELGQHYQRCADGSVQPIGSPSRLEPGAVEHVSPTSGDIHRVTNAYADRVSVSIHVYGVNIGRWPRATYTAAGQEKAFTSGYSNDTCPNFWHA